MNWPGWMKDWRRERHLRRELRELKAHYEPQVDKATEYAEEQALLAEWHFEAQVPESQLAILESRKLRRIALRWQIDVPPSERDDLSGLMFIPDKKRDEVWSKIYYARRENRHWWIRWVVVPLACAVLVFIGVLLRLD